MPQRDSLISPPTDYLSLQKDIVKTITEFKSKSFDNYYDFDTELSRTVNSLGIPGLSYEPFCITKVARVFPYVLVRDSEKSSLLKFEPTYDSLDNMYTNAYGRSLSNIVVSHIVPPSTELEDIVSEKPYDTILRWGRKFYPYILSEATLFQYSLNHFNYRTLHESPPAPDKYSVTYTDQDSQSQTAEVPMYISIPLQMSSLDDLCPSTSKSSSQHSNSQFSAFLNGSSIESSYSSPPSSSSYQSVPSSVSSTSTTTVSFSSSLSSSTSMKRRLRHRIPSNTAPSYEEIHPNSFYPAFSFPSLPLYLLNLSSSSSSSGDILQHTLNSLKPKLTSTSNLLIDLSSSTAPPSDTLASLFSLLFPSEFLRYRPVRYVASTATKNYLSSFPYGTLITNPTTNEIISQLQNTSQKEPPEVGEYEQYTRDWTEKFVLNKDYPAEEWLRDVDDTAKGKIWVTPPHLAVLVSEKTPGSAYDFILHLKEKHLAKIIMVAPSSISSLSPSDYQLAPTGLEITRQNSLFYDGQTLRSPLSQSFGTSWDTLETPLTFSPYHPDAVVSPSSDYDDELPFDYSLLQKVNALFATCLSSEVEEAECTPGTGAKEHEIYGHPCAAGTFDGSSCVFARCEDGYYRSSAGTCVAVPSSPTPPLCSFTTYSVFSYDSLYSCLQTLPIDTQTNVDSTTIDTLLKYLETYVFRDIILKPPPPFTESIDLVAGLQALKVTDYSNAFDFHFAINHLLQSTKDAHVTYTLDCIRTSFTLGLPFSFSITEDNGQYRVSMSSTKTYFFEHWSTLHPGITHMDHITHITFADLEDNPDEDPAITIARWAEKFSSSSRTPAARLNDVLSGSLNGQPVMDYHPRGSVLVKGKIEEADENEITLSLPWYAFSNINTDDFINEKCPPVAPTTARANNEDRRSEAVRFVQETLDACLSETEENSTQHKVCEYLKKNPESYIEYYLRTPTRASETEKMKKMTRLPTSSPTPPPFMSLSPPSSHPTPSPPPSPSSNFTSLSSSATTAAAPDWQTVPPMIEAFQLYYSDQHKTLYIHLPSFEPKDNEFGTFITIASTITAIIAQIDPEKIIIDVRGNGGGSIPLQQFLPLFIYPHDYPFLTKLEATTAPQTLEYLEKRIAQHSIFDYETGEEITDITKLSKHNRTDGTDGESREQEYIGPFAPGIFAYLTDYLSELKNLISNDPSVTPQQVVVVTDGLCGSSCANFVNRLRAQKLAKFVGLGQNLVNTIPFDISSFGGGQVFSSEMFTQSNEYSEANRLALPRYSALFRYPGFAAFSADWARADDTWQEFEIIEPDVVLPIFSTAHNAVMTADELEEMYAILEPQFDTCYEWEVKEASCTPTDEKQKIENALYGYPCGSTTHAFDDSQCVFARCMTGYYLDKNGACVKNPFYKLASSSPGNDKKFPVWAIILIVVVVIAVIVLVVALVVIYRKKSDRYT